MTTREIDALTPGRELDAMISREVFGQCPHLEIETEYIWYGVPSGDICSSCSKTMNPFEYKETDQGRKYIDYNDWSCPDYSTDLNAAFKVVERLVLDADELQDRFFKLHVSDYGKEGKVHIWVFFGATASRECSTAAEAICKAALKLLRNRE